MANIYLAGKITYNGWRHSLVAGLRAAPDYGSWSNQDTEEDGWLQWPPQWPILQNAIFGEHNYTGPYFLSDDHGCYHGHNTHGFICRTVCYPIPEAKVPARKRMIHRYCWQAINASDLVFAWIESPDAHGTFVEIGYAAGQGKHIFIAGPEHLDDLWFVYNTASLPFGSVEDASPETALRAAIDEYSNLYKEQIHEGNLESPIEEMFWQKGEAHQIPGLVPQVKVGKYRLDFGIPEEKIGVELDGHASHSTKDQREKDAKRQRFLEKQGWRIIRFTGTEIYRDPEKCVNDAWELIKQYRREAT